MKLIAEVFGFRWHAVVVALKLVVQFVFYFALAVCACWGIGWLIHFEVQFDFATLKWLAVPALVLSIIDRRTSLLEKRTTESAALAKSLRCLIPKLTDLIEEYIRLPESDRSEYASQGVFDDLADALLELDQMLMVQYLNSTLDVRLIKRGTKKELKRLWCLKSEIDDDMSLSKKLDVDLHYIRKFINDTKPKQEVD